MNNMKWKILLGLPVLLLALAAPVSLAGDDARPEKKSRHLVIGDRLQNIAIETEGSELTVTMTEDGHSRVAVVDLDQVGLMVNDTLEDLAAGLADMQLEFRLGSDNNLSFAMDEEEFEVDLDAIMSEVAVALEGAFGDMDTSTWTSRHGRWDMSDADEAELREELADLRRELKSLKRELARIHDRRDAPQ